MSKRKKYIEVPNLFNSDIEIPEDLKEDKERKFKPVSARSKNQKDYIKSIISNDVTFAVGYAGSGKTHIAVGIGYQLLLEGKIKHITIARPAVEAYENLGFQPGDYKEKLAQYLLPIYDEFLEFITQRELDSLIKDGTIRIAPLGFLRGRNLKEYIIIDESQNCNIKQLKLILSRMCPESKIVLTGDPSQSDLNDRDGNDFYKLAKLLSNIDGIGVVYLDKTDVQRHRLVPIICDIIDNIDKPKTLEERWEENYDDEFDHYDRTFSQLYD